MKINNFGARLAGASIFFFIFFILLTCNDCVSTTRQSLEHPDGTVANCFSGDTLKLTDRRVARLAGIDAPDPGKKGGKAQFYGRQARDELLGLARGKKVKLLLPGIVTHDRHGRIIANVMLDEDHSLNEMMVERGAAFFFPHQDLNPEFQERLRDLQAEAIKERRGLWANLLALPIARNNYVGDRETLRFFPENCPAAQKIKPRNRIHFGTLMDAFLSGFAPARICPFWPDAS